MYTYLTIISSLMVLVNAEGSYKAPWFCHKLDCPRFAVINTTLDYELRHYLPSKWVTTNMTVTTYGRQENGRLFGKLFQYISGNNLPGEKVTMTAPVLTTVIPESTGETTYIMHFMIPFDKITNTPVPSDPTVYLVDFPAMDAYVGSFGGFAYDGLYKEKLKLLQSSLMDTSLYDTTKYYEAGYDSPFAFVNRHNEVWVAASTQS